MSDQTTKTNTSNTNIQEFLQIFQTPDGTFTRKSNRIPITTAIADPNNPIPVLSKDIPINKSKNTWARIFLPRQALASTTSNSKYPLVIYFHGGGFILFSPDSTFFHDFCSNIVTEVSAIVVSIKYRLAPEHRLPAAYDDAVEAFHWIKTTQEAWLREYVDYTSCFIVGSSAGGNISYHAGLRISEAVLDFMPLKIRGMILHQPFFGGTQKTESELRLMNDPILPQGVTDFMWELSLPIGVDFDHEYSNPTLGGGSKLLDQIKLLDWRVLVTGCYGDPLVDRQVGMVKLMKERGVKVEGRFIEGGYHGVDVMEPSMGRALLVALKNFIESSIVS